MAPALDDASASGKRPVDALIGAGSRTIRNTALVMAARVVSRVLALAVLILMNRHLSADEYGAFATTVSISGLVAVVMDLGFNTLFQREAARDPSQLSRYLSNLATVRPLFAIAALVVFAFGVDVFNRGELAMIPAGFVMLLLASYANLLRGSLYAVQRLGLEAIAIVAEATILLVAVIAGVLTHQGPTYYLWAYAISYGFDCVYFFVVLHWRGIARLRPSLDWHFVGTWARIGLPFALTFIITAIYYQVDQPLVTFFKGHAEGGWYASGYKVFGSVLFLPQTMLSVGFPVLSVMWKERDPRFTWAVERFWKGLLAIGLPVTIGCVMLSPALRFIYYYRQSEPSFQILSIGILFMFVTNAFIGALNAMERQSSFAWAAFWSMVINVGTNLVAIPLWGYIGASWTTVLTEGALTTIGFFLLRRHLAALPIHRLSWRIVIAGLVMGGALVPFRGVTGWPVVGVIVAAALLYAIVLLLVRAIDRDEWAFVRGLLPVGRR